MNQRVGWALVPAIVFVAVLALLELAPSTGLMAGCPGPGALCQKVPSGSSGGGGSTTTYNPADKNSQITLNGTDLIATNPGPNSVWVSVRSTSPPYTTGSGSKKVYAHIIYDGMSDAQWLAGVADASTSLNTYAGSTGVSVGFGPHTSTTQQYSNGVTAGALCAGTTPGDAWIAIDINSGKMWCELAGCTNWNANSNGNPSTGANPAYTFPTSTVVYLISSLLYTSFNDIATLDQNPNVSGCSNLGGYTAFGT